jgi:hypothetical protein
MLTEKMSQWRELATQIKSLQEKAAALEAEIASEVLTLGKSQQANGVKASYTKGRGSYDYKAAVDNIALPDELYLAHQKISYDYKAMCEAAEIDTALYYKAGTPSVKLQLED